MLCVSYCNIPCHLCNALLSGTNKINNLDTVYIECSSFCESNYLCDEHLLCVFVFWTLFLVLETQGSNVAYESSHILRTKLKAGEGEMRKVSRNHTRKLLEDCPKFTEFSWVILPRVNVSPELLPATKFPLTPFYDIQRWWGESLGTLPRSSKLECSCKPPLEGMGYIEYRLLYSFLSVICFPWPFPEFS